MSNYHDTKHLGLIVRGDIEDKIDFLFTMYDLQGDGVVSRSELSMMLNSVVFAAYTIVEASAVELDPSAHRPANADEKLSPEIASSLHNRVAELVQSAFAQIETTVATSEARLSKQQFREWIIAHGEALDVIESLMSHSSQVTVREHGSLRVETGSSKNGKVTFEDIVNSPASPALSKTKRDTSAQKLSLIGVLSLKTPAVTCKRCLHVMRISFCNTCGNRASEDLSCLKCGPIVNGGKLIFCLACGYDLRLNDKPLEPLYGSLSTSCSDRQACQMEGWLYKVGSLLKNIKTRWFVLKDNFLYSFRTETSARPSGVIYLEGCFVEKIDDSRKNAKLKFGIEILISEKLNQRRNLYAKSEAIRDAWIDAIRKGARQFVLSDYYEVGRELGIGKFSSVRAATHKTTGKKYAVKIIDKSNMDDDEREALRTEIAVLQLVSHAHVIHLKNVFESKDKIYIVTTLVEGGDLFDRIVKRRRFEEDKAKAIITQVLQAIGYLHARGIVHRDLKPENIMMTFSDRDDHVQVGDFGLSKFAAPEEIMKLPCGTLAYVAPEVLQMKGYGRQVDLWSVGVIMFVLLRGKLPFDAKNRSDIIAKTLKGDLPIESDPLWNTVSAEAIDMVRKLLEPDPKKRLTVAKALKHEWITGVKNSDTAATSTNLAPSTSYSESEDDEMSSKFIVQASQSDLDVSAPPSHVVEEEGEGRDDRSKSLEPIIETNDADSASQAALNSGSTLDESQAVQALQAAVAKKSE